MSDPADRPRPEAAPGDLVTCPACGGRWWGESCRVCDNWGVVHIAQAAEIPPRPLSPPLSALEG